jgi:hypothetical protein
VTAAEDAAAAAASVAALSGALAAASLENLDEFEAAADEDEASEFAMASWWGWLYKNPVVERSLKAAWFQPLNLKCDILVC